MIGKRRLQEAELLEQIEQHKRWLNGEAWSQKADFQLCELNGLSVPQGVDLSGSSFAGASVEKCDFSRTTMCSCDFTDASLADTRFHSADLRGANLEGATGLVSNQLAGSNLAGAKLPAALQFTSRIASLNTATDSIGKMICALIVAGASALLYAWAASDATLINNGPTKANPFSSIEIPFLAFGIIVPFVMVLLSLFIQIPLKRFWNTIVSLPAVFEDGRTLNETVSWWFGHSLIRQRSAWIRNVREPLSSLDQFLDIICLWWFVPVVTGLLLVRFFVCHQWHLSLLHSGFLAGSAVIAISCRDLAQSTMRGTAGIIWNDEDGVNIVIRHAVIALVVFAPIAAISVATTDVFGIPSANLQDANISTIIPLAHKSDLHLLEEADIQGASLRNRDLRRANMQSAFIAQADLFGSNFSKADMNHAYLSGANLSNADFRDANLRCADLRGARLDGADFAGADVTGANLTGSDVEKALNLLPSQMKSVITTSASFGKCPL